MGFAPEVMAYLKVRPDKLDDTQAQLAADHLVGASPRGWEDISNVLKSGLSERRKRLFVQGRIGAANAAEFFGVLRELQAGADVVRLLRRAPGRRDRGAAAAHARRPLRHDLRPARRVHRRATAMARALEIVEQLPDAARRAPLPIREAQTLAMELLLQTRAGARPRDRGARQPRLPALRERRARAMADA